MTAGADQVAQHLASFLALLSRPLERRAEGDDASLISLGGTHPSPRSPPTHARSRSTCALSGPHAAEDESYQPSPLPRAASQIGMSTLKKPHFLNRARRHPPLSSRRRKPRTLEW